MDGAKLAEISASSTVTVEGEITHLRAHGKKLMFVDVDQAGTAIELLIKEDEIGGKNKINF